jgi:4-hydroxy-tetrahydrodipicolinate reductase
VTIRVGVVGATGRMGTAICAAVAADADLELAGAVARKPGVTVQGVPVGLDRDALAEAGAEVVVDVSSAEGARLTARWAAAHGLHAVIGTTGLNDDDLAHWRSAFTRSHCLVAPNFAIGAVLLMRFAELAAPLFETAEVIELHHDAKADAPSGTALLTAARMAAASGEWAPDPTRHEAVPGARGGTGPGGIHIHSVRLRGLVAHQEVLLGTTGQSLTLRHDSYDRSSFMPGVLLACKRIADHPGVTVGLDAYLGL